MSGHVLVARLDSEGDVLLTGPALRAVAASAERVVLLCGPRGAQAAHLLPGIDEIIVWRAPWIDPEPPPVDAEHVARLVHRVGAAGIDEAVLVTSFHQSPLPLALLLRLADVKRVAAICEDYPGSLLDVRHRVDDDIPEAERALSLAEAAGFSLPPGDDGRLAVRRPLLDTTALTSPMADTTASRGHYVVLHPGATASSRAWPSARCAQAVRLLWEKGHPVVVTGGPGEEQLTRYVAGEYGVDLGGRTTFAELASILERAAVLVAGNTGPAHLAAAVGTPVVSLFSPVVPAARWAPYGVPCVVLGDQDAPCKGTRARACPVPGHPCLDSVTPEDVLDAVESLVGVAA